MRRFPALLALLCAAPALAETRPFTPEELLQTRRLDDVQVAPDGRRVAFTVRQKRLDDNRDSRDVWLLDLADGKARQFTRDGHSDHARFSPDGRRLLVVSDRVAAEPQLFLYDLDGGDGKKLTSLHNGASDGIWSPDGKLIAFISEVNPACTGSFEAAEACTKKKADEHKKSKVKAHVTERLLFRHWNEWRESKRNHVFVMNADGTGARDLTPGDADWPTWRIGGGASDLSFGRDGKTLYVSHKPAEGEAWKTNSDIFAVPTDGGAPRNLTAHNQGDDASPSVSPDGKWLAWRSQARPGYEADTWKLKVMELSTGKERTLELSDDASSLRWKRDSSGLVVEMAQKGRGSLHEVSLDGRVSSLSKARAGSDFALLPDGSALSVVAGLVEPPELHRIARGGKATKVTGFNAEQYAGLRLGTVEEQWVDAADGAKVHSWIVKPPTAGARAPLIVLIHGGPQGAWEDGWTMRWNAAAFAARGAIVLLVNPRGSTSYGAKFKEEISQDWGGKVYDDILRSVDAAEKRSDVEPGRTCAAGASYGGYMVNWIAGHTDRFVCLVSHAGVFDLVAKYGSTEELWFPEWEFGGPYWENPEQYRKWSPSQYVKAFKTPTLVTMGELDYRISVEQGFGMFTALQRRGVPSKLVSFPDEGHWINKPRNSLLWYRTALEWIERWSKGKQGDSAAAH